MAVIQEETEESVIIPDYAGLTRPSRFETGFCQNHTYYSQALFDVNKSICKPKKTKFFKKPGKNPPPPPKKTMKETFFQTFSFK